jgi:hypothetical protein
MVGRPRKIKEESRDPHTRDVPRETNGRAPRVPMSAGGKLKVPESLMEEGYQYYWAVDRPGELEKFKAAWWEFVTDERNEPITTPAGRGETHFLMRIPKEYYDEDIARQQDRVNDALIENAKLKQGEYVPEGHDGVLTREVIV